MTGPYSALVEGWDARAGSQELARMACLLCGRVVKGCRRAGECSIRLPGVQYMDCGVLSTFSDSCRLLLPR